MNENIVTTQTFPGAKNTSDIHQLVLSLLGLISAHYYSQREEICVPAMDNLQSRWKHSDNYLLATASGFARVYFENYLTVAQYRDERYAMCDSRL